MCAKWVFFFFFVASTEKQRKFNLIKNFTFEKNLINWLKQLFGCLKLLHFLGLMKVAVLDQWIFMLQEHELQQANAELLQKVKISYLLPQPTVQFQLLLSLFGGLWTASLLKIKVAVSFFSKYMFLNWNMQNPFWTYSYIKKFLDGFFLLACRCQRDSRSHCQSWTFSESSPAKHSSSRPWRKLPDCTDSVPISPKYLRDPQTSQTSLHLG